LSKVVKSILSTPGSSVPSEKVFSVLGNIVTQRRVKLSPQHVEELGVLHENHKYVDV